MVIAGTSATKPDQPGEGRQSERERTRARAGRGKQSADSHRLIAKEDQLVLGHRRHRFGGGGGGHGWSERGGAVDYAITANAQSQRQDAGDGSKWV